MPRYSKKEYLELCGIEHAYLSVNLSRGKVVLNENDEIDTSEPINAKFTEKRIAALKKKALNISAEKVEEAKPKKRANAAKVPDREKTAKSFDLDTIKKELEIEEKETSIAINKIKLDKLNGVVIPTDLVTVIFSQHTKSITTAFHQAAENFVVDLAASYGVTKKDIAKMRGELIDIVNQAVKESLEDSRKGINNIVDEYAINGK